MSRNTNVKECRVEKIPQRKLKGTALENATMIGSCAILTCMGDFFTFKLRGIKYTFRREWEK